LWYVFDNIPFGHDHTKCLLVVCFYVLLEAYVACMCTQSLYKAPIPTQFDAQISLDHRRRFLFWPYWSELLQKRTWSSPADYCVWGSWASFANGVRAYGSRPSVTATTAHQEMRYPNVTWCIILYDCLFTTELRHSVLPDYCL